MHKLFASRAIDGIIKISLTLSTSFKLFLSKYYINVFICGITAFHIQSRSVLFLKILKYSYGSRGGRIVN